jgi:uncharacterized damage-inducible protein DinB
MESTRRSFLLEPPDRPLPAAILFLRHARFRLREDYLVKINAALAELDDEQIWRRPNETSNSIGNLMLHLAGNVRQWIVAGVGGAADARDRASEFAERGRIGKSELLDRLKTTLDEVDEVLAKVESDCAGQADLPLQRLCKPQAFDQTVLDAIFHVVEHFSYHTGQIVFIAKWLTGGRVQFYDDRQLNLEE